MKEVVKDGVGSIGKTTTCKTLCNKFSSKYKGRVCHLELKSTNSNSKELSQKVLVDLTRKSIEVLQPLNEGEVSAQCLMPKLNVVVIEVIKTKKCTYSNFDHFIKLTSLL